MAMDPRLVPLAACMGLNTRLMGNCFRDATDEAALTRPEGHNNMAFLGAHLVDARRYLANLLGPEVDNPFPELADGKTIDDFPELPKVEEILAAWRRLGDVVVERMEAVPAKTLEAIPEQKFPVSDPTLLGGVAFLVTHEAYHVGQLAYLRKLVGLGPMSYD